MGKIILLVLLAIAAICGSCASPLFKADITNKVPYISIGNKYIYYHPVSTGVVRCDTVQVTGVEGECIYFSHKKDSYVTSKSRFKGSTDKIKTPTKK